MGFLDDLVGLLGGGGQRFTGYNPMPMFSSYGPGSIGRLLGSPQQRFYDDIQGMMSNTRVSSPPSNMNMLPADYSPPRPMSMAMPDNFTPGVQMPSRDSLNWGTSLSRDQFRSTNPEGSNIGGRTIRNYSRSGLPIFNR